jgi:predicted nucleic acid-binding protein
MGTYLIDTNLLLRSADKRSAQHELANSAIAQLIDAKSDLFITAQNLVEFWAVATRPVANNGLGWDKARALRELDGIKELFLLAPDSPEALDNWLKLIRERPIFGKRSHDAKLAAILITNRIERLLTFNIEDFLTLGIEVTHPNDCLPKAS